MLPSDGYNWVLDDASVSTITKNSSEYKGYIGIQLNEGVGALYDTFLDRWINSEYQLRYQFY
jgi:hypothetical protein